MGAVGRAANVSNYHLPDGEWLSVERDASSDRIKEIAISEISKHLFFRFDSIVPQIDLQSVDQLIILLSRAIVRFEHV